jgi:hypothetical protein
VEVSHKDEVDLLCVDVVSVPVTQCVSNVASRTCHQHEP